MKELFIRPIAVFLALTVIITASIMTISSAAATPTSVGYQLYLSDFLLDNPGSQRIITGKYISPYRKLVEDRKDDPVWNASLQSWAILTFDLSDLSSYCEKSIGYYEAILFDVLCDSQESENSMADLNAICKSTQAGAAKKIYDLYGNVLDISLADLQKDTAQYDKVMNSIQNMEELSNAFGIIKNISTVVQYCTNVNDIIVKCSRLQSALEVYSQAGLILEDISNKTSDLSLKYACQKFKTILDNSVDEAEFLTIFIEEDTIFELSDSILGDVWDMLVNELTGYGLAIKTGQTMGKLAANTLFSTDEMIECYYSMQALYEFEDCLRSCVQGYESSYKSSSNFSRSVKYNEGFLLLAKTELEGSEYALKFLEIMNEKGLINECYHNVKESNMTWLMGVSGAFLDYTQRNYETEKRMIASTTSEIVSVLEYITTYSYNDYVEIIQDYVAVSSAPIVIEKEPQLISDEALENYIKSLDNVSQQFSNRSFDKATTLTEDITVYGDVYMSANVDLNGHSLNIAGNLYQTFGSLTINNGTLNVAGDYLIQGEPDALCSGWVRLVMNKENDVLNIAGTFSSCTCYYDYSASDDTYGHILSAGTMNIGGDFFDYSGNLYAFQAVGTHKVVLCGTEKQIVHMPHYSWFRFLEATNPNIECTSYFSASLNSDIQLISNNATIDVLNLNHKSLIVIGDVRFGYSEYSTLDLNYGSLTIQGTLYQSQGSLIINNGTLSITDDYVLSVIGKNDDDTYYSHSSGRLVMTEVNDKVIIDGNFISNSDAWYNEDNSTHLGNVLNAGTIYLHGNFSSYEQSRYFQAEKEHTIVLCGTELQTISFWSTDNYLGTIESLNPNIVSDYLGARKLGSNLTISSDNIKVMHNLDLNGKTLTINGDIEFVAGSSFDILWDIDINNGTMNINGTLLHSDGMLEINGGTLNISDDYCIQKETMNSIGEVEYFPVDAYLVMTNDNDKVNIVGSFITRSTDSHTLYAGVMNIGKDIYDWDQDIEASGSHKTILNGTSKQTVYFDNSSSHFNILELTKPRSNYTFTPDNCWNELIESYNEKPEPPVVTATPGDKQVTLTWEAVADAEMYRVYLYVNGAYTRVYSGDSSATSAIITGLTNGTKYGFVASAKANGFWSDYSEIVYATPRAVVKPKITGFKVGDNKVKLEWTSFDGAEMYRVYTYADGAYKRQFTCDGTRNVATVTGLESGKEYGFVVSAKVDGAWTDYSDKSDLVYATPTGVAKPSIVGYKVGNYKVKLEWKAVDGAEMYRVYTYENGVYTRKFTCAGARNIATVTGLVSGTNYGFVVSAKVDGVWTDYADAADLVYATPTGDPAPVITGYKTGDGKVKLTWYSLEGAEMYRVYSVLNGVYTRQFTTYDSTTATVTGLENGTEYGFVVSAKVNGTWTPYNVAELILYATPSA